MQKHILADTSCLILLEKINHLDWLRELFGQLIIAEEVAGEFGSPIPDWIQILKVQNELIHSAIISENLGSGESASIALALECENPLLILDDLKARRKARSLNLSITGTSGVLLLAKKKGLCQEIKPLLDALKENGMWISPRFYNTMLKLAEEA